MLCVVNRAGEVGPRLVRDTRGGCAWVQWVCGYVGVVMSSRWRG